MEIALWLALENPIAPPACRPPTTTNPCAQFVWPHEGRSGRVKQWHDEAVRVAQSSRSLRFWPCTVEALTGHWLGSGVECGVRLLPQCHPVPELALGTHRTEAHLAFSLLRNPRPFPRPARICHPRADMASAGIRCRASISFDRHSAATEWPKRCSRYEEVSAASQLECSVSESSLQGARSFRFVA